MELRHPLRARDRQPILGEHAWYVTLLLRREIEIADEETVFVVVANLADIAGRRHRDISQQAFPSRPGERAALETALEPTPFSQQTQPSNSIFGKAPLRGKVFRPPRRFLGLAGLHGLVVPWAYFLADIATENPAAEFFRQVLGQFRFGFDGPKGNAFGGIQLTRTLERLGGTLIEAARATSAKIFDRRGAGQFRVQEKARQMECRPMVAIQGAAVLTAPAQPGFRGEIAFEYRRRIHESVEGQIGLAHTLLQERFRLPQ